MRSAAATLALLALALAPAASGAGGDEPVLRAPGAEPVGACAEAVAARVQAHYEGVRDLSAHFAQATRSVMFGGATPQAEQRARGEVVFAKPGRMRWTYTEPEPSLVVSDGRTLWIHDPEAGEVQELPVGSGFLSGAAFQFLLGEGQLLETFRVRARGCGEPRVELELTPREPATYERLELRVDPQSGDVHETTVIDLFGNRTDVVFQDVRRNQDPPDATFRFEVPPGTRVLRLPEAP
jgi:outer membrane lipoprotein-sorting protein